MADLVDTGRLIGIERIKLRAEDRSVHLGRPTDDAWREMKREAYGFTVQHMSVLRHLIGRSARLNRSLERPSRILLTMAELSDAFSNRKSYSTTCPRHCLISQKASITGTANSWEAANGNHTA
jgi:hypothetical protein